MDVIKDENLMEEIEVVRKKLDEIKVSGYLKGNEDAKIYYEYYKNKNEDRKNKAIVISHGYSEDLIKYTEIINMFYERGYSVYAIEHRGMGRSTRLAKEPTRIHVEDYRYYIDDLKRFVDSIVKVQEKGNELFIFGHSQGGLIATLYAAKYPKDFTRTILSSPYYYMSYRIPRWIVKLFCKVTIALGMKEIIIFHNSKRRAYPAFEELHTTSKARYEFMKKTFFENEDIWMVGGTIGWLYECVKAQDFLFKKKLLLRLKGRYLLVTCGKDTMVSTRLHYKMKKKVPKMELLQLPEAKHEAYTEKYEIQKKYYDKIFDFLEKK